MILIVLLLINSPAY
ncbi:hypothetical protein [Escherichia marmotae]